MEDNFFDVGGILTGDEAEQLFNEQAAAAEAAAQQEEIENNNQPAEEEEEEDDPNNPESVGGGNKQGNGDDAVDPEGDGSSPNVYSSMAEALRNDGILPDFTDDELKAVTTPEAFAEMFKKAIDKGIDERVKRADEALQAGVAPTAVQQFEQTLEWLGSIDEDAIKAEGEEGINLRRQLIFNDLIKKGYTEDQARKKMKQSFDAGDDVDDAKDALDFLTKHYQGEYQKVQDQAKQAKQEAQQRQKQQADSFKKLVLEDEVKIGETVLDKKTCQRVFDAVSRPIHKDPETGKLMTEVQKFQKEHPLEFLKQLGMWFVLTDGGKDLKGFTRQQVQAEKNKSIKELGRKINSTALNRDGSLRYTSHGTDGSDPLLSDGWKVGW